MSYNINGQSWSWEQKGWSRDTTQSYLQQNSYRDGTGFVLDGGPEWNRRLAEGIMHGYDNVDNGIVLPGFGGYNLVQNNCAEGFCRAINNMGGLPRNVAISPAAHREYIQNNLGPNVIQINRYPQVQVAQPNIQIGPMVGGP